MSNRSLLEFNHDFCPGVRDPDGLLRWALMMADYMRNGDKTSLPRGVTFKHFRHHSDPDPMEGRGDPS